MNPTKKNAYICIVREDIRLIYSDKLLNWKKKTTIF